VVARVGGLERIFAPAVELIEVVDLTALATAMEMYDVLCVVLDASASESSRASSQPRDLGQSFDRCGGATETAEVNR
jgi:hypothetical protein